ncbi:MFS transporter [Pseudonocardia sp. CA-107938]|uniref:MFS transporter n=1 Tax=Pseudonocardia sp. CA-107938 TaxID=3240021 RepID=UPI003D9258E7
MPLALLALAISAFGIGTTEFAVAGLLPDVSADLGVDIPAAGLLVTGYALAVAIGAPLLTAAATRLPRKTVLLGLLGLFVLGNLLTAVATSYGLVMLGRVVAALCHGAFFGVGSVVAAGLVPPQRRAAAIALMFTGLTVANVVGVPLGTAIGHAFGWRTTFWVITVLGVVAVLGVLALVPRQPADPAASLRAELAAFGNPRLWLALATTALGFGGLFAAFTYVAPLMIDVAGFPAGAVTWIVLVFGIGAVVGNLAGAKAADRALVPSLLVLLALLALLLGLFTITAAGPVPAIVTLAAIGVVGFATVPGLQTRVLDAAGSAGTLASAANISAFNLGNAVGAWLGGLTIGAGLGLTSPSWVGALMVAGAFGIALAGARRRERVEVAA